MTKTFSGLNGYYHRVFDLTKIKKELDYRDVVSIEEALRRTIDWHINHPPEVGGEEERLLGDPFDYQTEDKIIQAYKDCTQEVLDIPFYVPEYHHKMPHPKTIGTPRDERGR